MTKAVFFGTPEAALPALETLNGLADIAAVITQPDRARGRSGRLVPPPIKSAAAGMGLAVLQPRQMSEVVESAAGADIGVLVAFGRLLPSALLAAPRLGTINIHFSLLPRWRGASPVHHAILQGDHRTGVTLMQMDEGLDTGPILASCQTLVGGDNLAELTSRLALLGADQLAASWRDLVAGAVAPQPQDDGQAMSAPLLTSQDQRISVREGAEAVLRRVRAFAPHPGAWGLVNGDRFKILDARVGDGAVPEGAIDASRGKPTLGTADGVIELITVQPAGKPVMAAADWFNGRRRQPASFS